MEKFTFSFFLITSYWISIWIFTIISTKTVLAISHFVGDLISYVYPELLFIGIKWDFETINNNVCICKTPHNSVQFINYIQFVSPDTKSHVRKYPHKKWIQIKMITSQKNTKTKTKTSLYLIASNALV